MELCTASIDSCLTIKKMQDKVLTSYYLAKWSKINIFLRNSSTYSSFFCKKMFQPIYTDYAYFEEKKNNIKNLLLKCSLVGPLSKLYATPQLCILHPIWLPLLLVENSSAEIFL